MDVILRRVDDSFCDPIELRSDSFLGVAGLVEAVRAGNVAVANALGSGLIETSAFMPFLPGLSRRMLGEELKLPPWRRGGADSRSVRLCARESGLPGDQAGLSRRKGMEPVFGGKLAGDERSRIAGAIRSAGRTNFVGQELVNLSTVPVWSEQVLAPRRVVLRVFLAAVRRFLGGDARRTGARFVLARHAGGFHAARRRQQGHLGSFERAGRTRRRCSVRAICRSI